MTEIPISENSLKRGYLFIYSKQRKAIFNITDGLKNSKNCVEVILNKKSLGLKYVDYKYHRIAIGKEAAQNIAPNAKLLQITSSQNKLILTTL